MKAELLSKVLLERLDQFMAYSKESHTNHDKKLDELSDEIKLLAKTVQENTDFRNKVTTAVELGKWSVGALGISNIVTWFKILG